MSRPRRRGRDVHGVLLLDKPQGASSNDVLQKVKRIYNANRAGHTGALDPLANVGPRDLNISTLLQRLGGVLPDRELADSTPEAPLYDATPTIHEVILATDPNTEGEATAAYLVRLLRDFPDLKITRLASGMPLGGDLEFVDELTLSRALSGRLTI